MESKAKWIFSGVEAAIFGRLNPNTGTLDEIKRDFPSCRLKRPADLSAPRASVLLEIASQTSFCWRNPPILRRI